MINIKSKRCLDCNKISTFNFEGETKPLYCTEHKKPGMIDIKSKRCLDCNKRPAFNFEGETKALYCTEHKKPGMINIKSKRCLDCNKISTFNFEGETKPLYCVEHKKPGMIDIKHKRCLECNKRPSYGFCLTEKTHCASHKSKYMLKEIFTICEEKHCKEYSIYGKEKPIFCQNHKRENDICWLVKPCNKCKSENEILNKEGICMICSDTKIHEYKKRRDKVKEKKMIEFLNKNIYGKESITDIIIDSSCNNYRPDILYDVDTHIVVVECDEKQHKYYNWEQCTNNKSLKHYEEKRMFAISQAYGLPAIFLRWNPDNFKVNGNIDRRYNLEKRLNILLKWVEYSFKIENFVGVRYKELFYDEYEETNLSFKNIEEKDLI